MNNRSARNAINNWLICEGKPALGEDLSYEEFARDLRVMMDPGEQAAFSGRPEAVAYVRSVATRIAR